LKLDIKPIIYLLLIFTHRRQGVVRKLRHALEGRRVGEFVTVQTQNFSFFGKFVTGEGVRKSRFFA